MKNTIRTILILLYSTVLLGTAFAEITADDKNAIREYVMDHYSGTPTAILAFLDSVGNYGEITGESREYSRDGTLKSHKYIYNRDINNVDNNPLGVHAMHAGELYEFLRGLPADTEVRAVIPDDTLWGDWDQGPVAGTSFEVRFIPIGADADYFDTRFHSVKEEPME